MKKRAICLLICFVCALLGAAQASDVRILSANEASPFEDSEALLRLYVINTQGASDAILIVHGGKTMLVDCGNINGGSHFVKPLLDTLGIDHIDWAYSTHPLVDHIGGFLSLFGLVPIDTFYTAFPFSYSEDQSAVIKAAMDRGIKVVPIDSETDLSFGDLSIWLYQDTALLTTFPGKSGSASMMMHITLGDSTFFITGDAEKQTFTDLYDVKGEAIQCDIFKVPAHGYTRPSYEVFTALAPKYAIITNFTRVKISDMDNFLRQNGCPNTITGLGTVECITDGKLWTIRQPFTAE